MKKLLLLLVVSIGITTTFAQEAESETSFPYGKMLNMSPKQLLEANFQYDSNKNQYVLTKRNGLNETTSILNALAGVPQNYVPHVNDYRVIIQGGETVYSAIEVLFYDSNVYDKVYEFATNSGQDLTQTGTGNLKFSYNNYLFELTCQRVGQSTSIGSWGISTSKDESYTIYTFVIYTGVPPSSAWHSKHVLKELKREAKGKKKQSAADLM